MSSDKNVAAFLAVYPRQVQATALAARRFVEGVLPGAAESLDKSAKLIGYAYGPGYKGVICTLIISQTRVKLGIAHGSELSDPNRLLTGTGTLHRHVVLRSTNDLRQSGLKRLLKDALTAWKERSARAET